MHDVGRIHHSSHHHVSRAHARVQTRRDSFASLLGIQDTGARQTGGPLPGESDVECHGSLHRTQTLGAFVGRSMGSGQCVALVRAANPHLGPTAHWVRGAPVQGNYAIPPGTPIATFSHAGHYANATDGSSHAAIYLSQNAEGMQVLDQWAGRPAAVRTIPWCRPGATAANTGSAFHVVNARTAIA